MTFNVQKGPFKFQKVSLTCEGGHPSPTPSPTPPRLVASLPHFVPPPPPVKKKKSGHASASRLLSEP